ncbi:MAG TPA: YrdB family protein [Micromonosporaceae bacterium]
MKALALVVRFGLELAVLAALVYAGVVLVSGPLGWLVGLVAALLAAAVWGVFVSPRARIILPTPARLAVEVAVFAAGCAALLWAGRAGASAALGGVYLADRLALWALGAPAFERGPEFGRSQGSDPGPNPGHGTG